MSSHDVPYPPMETPYRPESAETGPEVFLPRQQARRRLQQLSGTVKHADDPPAAPAPGHEHDAEAEPGTR